MSVTFKLQDFEGPLDLLLHLIEKNKMSIYDIEISSITDQYMAYLEDAKEVEMEQMSEFIVMAATLLYIKSRMLLPKHPKAEEEEEDPREELVRKLIEYKKVKYVSQQLSACQVDTDRYCFRNRMAHLDLPDYEPDYSGILDRLTLNQLYDTFNELMKQKEWENKTKSERKIDHNILKKDTYTIEQKSMYITNLIALNGRTTFFSICTKDMPKIELIVTFMALLELIHKKQVMITQDDPKGDIIIVGGPEGDEDRP